MIWFGPFFVNVDMPNDQLVLFCNVSMQNSHSFVFNTSAKIVTGFNILIEKVRQCHHTISLGLF